MVNCGHKAMQMVSNNVITHNSFISSALFEAKCVQVTNVWTSGYNYCRTAFQANTCHKIKSKTKKYLTNMISL